MYRACRRQASRLGIDDRIEWLGWMPHHEALQQYSWADVFAFTSLRDTSGAVVLEAFSNGVPVIALDHQGAADMVTPQCGIKIPVTSPRQVIKDYSEALVRLAREPGLLHKLSEGARTRAADYLWSKQGEAMAKIYRRALEDAGCAAEPMEPIGAESVRERHVEEVLT
jgi:glycosyltransferase involved in cell wall biosynthesis